MKKVLIFLMCMLVSIPLLGGNQAYAATTLSSYTATINGKTVEITPGMITHEAGASVWNNKCKSWAVGSKGPNNTSHVCCAGYAAVLFKQLWGKSFSSSIPNLLDNLSTDQRRISVERLKYFFENAQPGASVRFDKGTGTWRTDNGHELIFLGLTSNGGVFWEGNFNGLGARRIWSCTWTELYNRFNDRGYIYMPYIRYPNATKLAPINLPEQPTISGETYPTALANGKSYGLRGTISCKYTITNITARIYDASTREVAKHKDKGTPIEKSVSPNKTSYAIGNPTSETINSTLEFNYLPYNNYYRYIIEATYTKDGTSYKTTVLDKPFTVGTVTPILAISSVSGEYELSGIQYYLIGQEIPLRVVIENNYDEDITASSTIVSSNNAIASVSGSSIVIEGFGDVSITATKGNNTVTSSFTVACSHPTSTWETIQEPTYTSTGRKIRKCSICNETIATEDIPALAPINVTSVTLSTHAVTLAPNQTYQLFVTVLPTNATYQNCRWQSSNPDVATVSSNGLVTAISAGSANIICRSEKDDGTLDIATITVEPSHGACGDDLTWRFENPTLSIRGTGVMYNYALGSAPWYSYSDRITTITLENGVETIGEGAFYNMTHVSQVNLPPSLISIGNAAFDRCTSLTNINLPESLKTIGLLAFAQSGLTSVMLPNGLETLGDSAFQDCQQLQQVSIPYTLSAIPAYAFLRCNNLATIDVPVSIYKIGLGAFYDCSNLESIYLPDNITIIENDAFHGVPQNAEIHAYRKSYAAQYAKDNHFALVYSDSVMNAPDLWLPASLTEIGEEAFAGNPAEWIKLSAKVTTIGPRAFADCMNLTEIYIPETATSISATAFEGVPAGLTIYTKSGSYAEFYATNNGYNVHIVPSKTAVQ